MPMIQTRRRFLTTLSLAGAAGLLRARRATGAEGELETAAVRIVKFPGICVAPQYLAEPLLHAEGFTDAEYVDAGPTAELTAKVGRSEADFTMEFAAQTIQMIDASGAITILAGVHVGCHELFGNEGIRGIVDLKGKSVGVRALASNEHVLLTLMAADVGLDPVKDINWVTSQSPKPSELFADGKVEGFLAGPPESQDLRARRIGHVFLNTNVDRPWSQYFCCILAGDRDYVREHPVATKRVLRALLKAADICATEPARVARLLVDGGYTSRYDYALQMLSELPYDKWREYDPEDTLRFYALRLHEASLIKSSPNKIIADSTDWRFLNELKRELKA
jgi:NitT/TauT family transport system substrate-binding protein